MTLDPSKNTLEQQKFVETPEGNVAVRTLNIGGFIDAAARAANKNPVSNKSYVIPANTFSTLDLETQDARDLVYTYLKTLPGYNGAVDV